MHHDTYALAWETIPRSQKPALLQKAHCNTEYINACVDARWESLPPRVTAGLRPLFDQRVLDSCHKELTERENQA